MRLFGRRGPVAAAPRGATATVTVSSLGWIDEFFRDAGEHIFAREEDGVVILPPNQVFKANETGIAIVQHLRAGKKIRHLPGIEQGDRAAQVAAFASALRSLTLGDSADGAAPAAPLENIRYSFSFTKLPILGEIAVTWRCNNACLFCYAGCGGAVHAGTPRAASGGSGREMTLDDVKRVLRIFRDDAKIPFFSFTGGEPLLRPDLEAMIREARDLGLHVNLVTNGTLATAGRAQSLARAGLATAQVSVESPDERTHDGLTARPGSWKETLAGIRNLQDAGISVQTNTTVTARTRNDAPRMPEFLAGLGIRRFAMNLYIPVGRTAESPFTRELFIPYSDAGEVIDAVRLTAREHGLTFFWYSPVPQCHYNTIARGLGNKSCAAMDGLLSVSPVGDVLPCSSFPEPMGNLLTTDFWKIWFSERALFFKTKKYAPAECNGCSSFTACQSACPLYWRFAGTREIARANAAARDAQSAPSAGV